MKPKYMSGPVPPASGGPSTSLGSLYLLWAWLQAVRNESTTDLAKGDRLVWQATATVRKVAVEELTSLDALLATTDQARVIPRGSAAANTALVRPRPAGTAPEAISRWPEAVVSRNV